MIYGNINPAGENIGLLMLSVQYYRYRIAIDNYGQIIYFGSAFQAFNHSDYRMYDKASHKMVGFNGSSPVRVVLL
jgi:hypothetical protein